MRKSLALILLMLSASLAAHPASAEEKAVVIPPQITTPDSVDTSLGTLKFDDGIPSEDTAQKAYDQLDLQRGSRGLPQWAPRRVDLRGTQRNSRRGRQGQ